MTQPQNEDTNALAAAKVRRAMALVEEAQNKLMEACQELSPIIGAVPQWRKTSSLHDRVKAHWYALDAWLRKSSHRIDVDGSHKAWIEKRRQDGGAR